MSLFSTPIAKSSVPYWVTDRNGTEQDIYAYNHDAINGCGILLIESSPKSWQSTDFTDALELIFYTTGASQTDGSTHSINEVLAAQEHTKMFPGESYGLTLDEFTSSKATRQLYRRILSPVNLAVYDVRRAGNYNLSDHGFFATDLRTTGLIAGSEATSIPGRSVVSLIYSYSKVNDTTRALAAMAVSAFITESDRFFTNAIPTSGLTYGS